MNEIHSESNPESTAPHELPLGWKQRIWRTVRKFAIFYLILVAILTLSQRSLIYHPHKANLLTASEAGLPPGTLHDFEFESTDGLKLKGWHFLRSSERAENEERCKKLLGESRLVVLYFPGNAGHRGYRTVNGELLSGHDADVLLADYRGYGDNPGSPNEAMMLSDAHALWSYAVHECGIPSERIVIYGQSLGGGVAVRLASELCQAGTPPAGLITVASFSSLGDVAQDRFPFIPARWLLWDQFRSQEHISQVSSAYLHLHGTDDEVVPFEMGQQLFASAPSVSGSGIEKQFVTLERARHNDIFSGPSDSHASAAIGHFLRRLRNAGE